MNAMRHAEQKKSELSILVLAIIGLGQAIFGQAFTHPGCLSQQADFTRMKSNVQAGRHPWIDSWNILTNNYHAQTNYVPSPVPILQRGNGGGACLVNDTYPNAMNDAAAVYQLALRWEITGDNNYANAATNILNQWTSVCTNLCGDPNISLLPLYGYQFSCGAEIMRSYTNWQTSDLARCQGWMTNLWYPLCNSFLTDHQGTCNTYVWANWDLCNMACMLSIGVLCDNRTIYTQAINYYKTGVGNGAANQVDYYLHPGYMGQCEESGRDQGHCTLDPILLGVFCEIAWNQGDDMYGYNTNCLLAISEYVCKYNVQPPVSTVPYADFCDCTYDIQDVISSSSRGTVRPGYDLIYNHYVNRKGLSAPYTAQMARQQRPEGGGGNYGSISGGFDQLGFTTLTHTLSPIASNAVPAPSGLMAQVFNNAATVSWWGSAYASSYNIKRSIANAGSYTNIASGLIGDHYYTDVGLLPGTNYYYVVSAVIGGVETTNSLAVSAVANMQLTGTVLGSSGSYTNWNGTSLVWGATITNVYDGALGSFYDAAHNSGDWAGLDLGTSNVITQVQYCPRVNFSSRMVGGQFQGANVADFSSGVATLFTITTAPADTWPQMFTTQTINNPNAFRYVRYLGPANGSCNVSEVQFFGNPSPATTPVTPASLTATPGNTQVLLNWTVPAGATSFIVQRSLVSGGPYTTNATKTTTPTYLDTRLTNYTNYYYVVSAANATGLSANSAEVVAVPVPSSATNVVWSGAVDGIWDTTTENWMTNGSLVTYQNGNPVLFDDTASANTTVTPFVTVSPGSIIFNNSVKTYSISGSAITGAGGLTKLGSGSLVLNDANTFSGGVTISSGTVTVGNNSALGTGMVTLSGGTLFGGSSGYTLTNSIQAQTNTASTIDCGGNLTLNGNLTGSGTITRGAGATQTLFLGGNNGNFTGTYQDQNNANSITRWNSPNSGSANARWIFNQAQLASRTTPNFGTGTIQFGSISGGGYISQNSSGTVTLQVGDLGSNDTFSGSMQDGGGALALTKVGTGTLTLTGANSYSGQTTVSNGELIVSSMFATKGSCLVTNGAIFGVTNLSTTSAAISNLTLAAGCALEFINVTNLTTPLLTASNLSVGGLCTLKITGTNGLAAGNSYPLLKFAGTLSGAFTNLQLQMACGWRGALVNSANQISLASLAVVSTTLPQLTTAIAGQQLQLQWPFDHTGWRLLMNTNLAGTNWPAIPGAGITNLMLISPTNGSMFFRLAYP